MPFTKLDEGIVFSSIMGEDDSVFRVWIVLLATCKEDGVSHISETFLSTITKKNNDEISRCLKVLESPDEHSRSKNNDGRRVERIDGGFKVINYQRYREKSTRDYWKEQKNPETDEKSDTFQETPRKSKKLLKNPGCSASSSSSSLQEDMLSIYSLYPRRIARGVALRAIKKALVKNTKEFLIEAVKKYVVSIAGKDPEFIPYPATWFNQERWLDEKDKPAQQKYIPVSQQPITNFL